jgi:hypothetical protein
MYFGKTTENNPTKYSGSGLYWKRHLKKHTPIIETIYSELFDDANLLNEFALFFSEYYDIEHSDRWANLKPENGRDGNPVGKNFRNGLPSPLKGRPSPLKGVKTGRITSGCFKEGRINSLENRQKSSICNKGNTYGTKNKGRIAPNKGKSPSLESRQKMTESRTGLIYDKVTCPHCNKTGGSTGMGRWHFDHCKFKENNDSI